MEENDTKKVDYFCLNQELVKISHREPNSRCVEFANIKSRKRAESMTLKLIGEYPELGDLHTSRFRTIPTTILSALVGIKDDDERAKTLELIVTAMKTMTSPVTGRPYTGKRTITKDEWVDIRRIARGEEPVLAVRRECHVSPKDSAILAKYFNAAIAEARRCEPGNVVSRLEYFRDCLVLK